MDCHKSWCTCNQVGGANILFGLGQSWWLLLFQCNCHQHLLSLQRCSSWDTESHSHPSNKPQWWKYIFPTPGVGEQLSSRLPLKVLTWNFKFKNMGHWYIHQNQVDHLTSIAYQSNQEKAVWSYFWLIPPLSWPIWRQIAKGSMPRQRGIFWAIYHNTSKTPSSKLRNTDSSQLTG